MMNEGMRKAGGKATGRAPIAPGRSGRRLRPFAVILTFSLFLLWPPRPATAHPQFQQYLQKHSGRYTDCAMCHRNYNGPAGIRPGQLGSLTPAEKARYDQAQDALDPGQKVNSPILNDFGNYIIQALGRVTFTELANHPERLPDALGYASDLDGDGIPDAREYLDGTNPLNAQSGDPWLLFRINLKRNRFDVLMTLLVTVLGMYGLNNLFNGFSRVVDVAGQRRKTRASD